MRSFKQTLQTRLCEKEKSPLIKTFLESSDTKRNRFSSARKSSSLTCVRVSSETFQENKLIDKSKPTGQIMTELKGLYPEKKETAKFL